MKRTLVAVTKVKVEVKVKVKMEVLVVAMTKPTVTEIEVNRRAASNVLSGIMFCPGYFVFPGKETTKRKTTTEVRVRNHGMATGA